MFCLYFESSISNLFFFFHILIIVIFTNLYHINNMDTTRKRGKIKQQKAHRTVGSYILKPKRCKRGLERIMHNAILLSQRILSFSTERKMLKFGAVS